MNVVEELLKEANKTYRAQMDDAKRALETVKENLAAQDSEALRQLDYFGTSKVIRNSTKVVQETKEVLEKGTLTESQVKIICKRYRLKCLPAEQYVKEVPLKALNDINHYKKRNGIEEFYGRDQLFVIAPEDHFRLGPRPDKDPVVLHKDVNNNFKVISTWGDDFSNSREILCKIINNVGLLTFGVFLVISALIAEHTSYWWLIAFVPISFGFAILTEIIVDGGETFDPFEGHK